MRQTLKAAVFAEIKERLKRVFAIQHQEQRLNEDITDQIKPIQVFILIDYGSAPAAESERHTLSAFQVPL